jgi:hypothetical protein
MSAPAKPVRSTHSTVKRAIRPKLDIRPFDQDQGDSRGSERPSREAGYGSRGSMTARDPPRKQTGYGSGEEAVKRVVDALDLPLPAQPAYSDPGSHRGVTGEGPNKKSL